MNFNIEIQISRSNTFTGHWLTKCENWEAAMKRAYNYAELFMHNEGCTNIDFIKVSEMVTCYEE